MKKRCEWVSSEILRAYHDEEYGLRNYDDSYLFEILVLEFMQAGLSFETVLKKREAMRSAFDGFDYKKIASYDKEKIEKLLANEEIIRHKLKIKALVKNARAFMKIQEEYGSFDKYLQTFVKEPIDYKRKEGEVISESDLSKKLARDMKKRGFTFVGPTIIHSFMEAVGLVNCHNVSCFRHDEIENIKRESKL